MKSLVLAEKPSVGKEIAKALRCNNVFKTHCEGVDYIVTWAMGHLVELADPEDYKDQWKSWQLETLPMLPEKMKLQVIRKTSFQFNTIKKLLSRNDVNNLIIATDAGREGELVARWIMKLCGWKGSFQRLWISSQTDAAIRDGFKNLKEGSSYNNLFHAAECRAEADWIVGLNVTRALTCRFDAKLSAGRVQTPTLAIIVERENEIKNFKPEPYWVVNADLSKNDPKNGNINFSALRYGKSGNTRFKDNDQAKVAFDRITGSTGEITSVTVEEKSELPPLAYDLTSLQRDANRIMGFSAKKTLQTLQSLYERHKIVTYPRTDSKHITTDMVPTLKDRLRAIENTRFGSYAKELLKGEINPGKRLVDNSKVSDHHAIIPTEERVNIDRLDNDERSLWNLIAERFIAVLSKPYRYKNITVEININGEILKAKGITTIENGFKSVTANIERQENEDDIIPMQSLARLEKGDIITVKKANILQYFTKPPARYTEGTLLSAMESPGKFIEDEDLKGSIGGGLGTPATRADIIEKLFANHYIERNGKEIAPTSLGFELLEVAPEELKSPELTAKWEKRLSDIAKGAENPLLFTNDIRKNAEVLVNSIKVSRLEYKPHNESAVKCPVCGKKLLAVKDAKGKRLLVCRSFSCGYEQNEKDNSDDLTRRPSKREQSITRKLMNQYTDNNKKDTFTLGDLMKLSSEKKNK